MQDDGLDVSNQPLPAGYDEKGEVGEVLLSCGGIHDGGNGNAEEREGEDENEDPKGEAQHR